MATVLVILFLAGWWAECLTGLAAPWLS